MGVALAAPPKSYYAGVCANGAVTEFTYSDTDPCVKCIKSIESSGLPLVIIYDGCESSYINFKFNHTQDGAAIHYM